MDVHVYLCSQVGHRCSLSLVLFFKLLSLLQELCSHCTEVGLMLKVHILQCPLQACHLQVLLVLKDLDGRGRRAAYCRGTHSGFKGKALQEIKTMAVASAAIVLSCLEGRCEGLAC